MLIIPISQQEIQQWYVCIEDYCEDLNEVGLQTNVLYKTYYNYTIVDSNSFPLRGWCTNKHYDTRMNKVEIHTHNAWRSHLFFESFAPLPTTTTTTTTTTVATTTTSNAPITTPATISPSSKIPTFIFPSFSPSTLLPERFLLINKEENSFLVKYGIPIIIGGILGFFGLLGLISIYQYFTRPKSYNYDQYHQHY